jgi:anti-sigma factor RsiW
VREAARHPTSERLESYAEGTISAADRAVVASHLMGCSGCEAEVEDWRALLQALAALPRFAPALGFTNRVMAHVRIPEPWHARASAWIDRVLPKTTFGWAVAVAVLALPVVASGSLLAWLLSKSYVTAHGLWVFATNQFASAATDLAGGTMTTLMQTDIAAWLARTVEVALGATGARGFGALAAGASVLTMLSAWVLYRNLFRNPNGKTHYGRIHS